jgi:hypothetical protein
MPDDRLLHRRCLHSEKVSGLTDLEHRVWFTYELASDDYGVMRFSAAALQSANDAFEHRPAKGLQRAFHRLVVVGLIRVFHHQGKAYVYQPDWQYWQHVRNPRTSVQPLPPLESIEACEASTRKLFRDRLDFTGESPADSLEFARRSGSGSGNDATESQQQSGLRGKRLTADGERLSADGSEIRERFERFWESYPRKVGKGAAWRVWASVRPDEALLAVMLRAVDEQRRSAQWRKDGGQFIPHPSTWLNQERWSDSAVVEVDPASNLDGLKEFVRG